MRAELIDVESHGLVLPRLVLRPVSSDDREFLIGHWSDRTVRRFLFDGTPAVVGEIERAIVDSARDFAALGYGLWLICTAPGDAPIGTAGLRPLDDVGLEVFYSLTPRVWGRGYAIEAARGVIDYALGPLGLSEVFAEVDEGNTASAAVLGRVGMRPFGTVAGVLGSITRYRAGRPTSTATPTGALPEVRSWRTPRSSRKEAAMDAQTAHQRAQDSFAGILANVTPDRFGGPTPCTEWTIRDLIVHVVGGNNLIARRAGGSAESPSESVDLAEAYRASAAGAVAGFALPDAMDAIYDVPFGQIPGKVLIGMRATDVLTHAWDLAAATGQSTDLDPELATEMLAVARERVQPAFRGPGLPFGPEQPCAPGLPPCDRLAAFLGRNPLG